MNFTIFPQVVTNMACITSDSCMPRLGNDAGFQVTFFNHSTITHRSDMMNLTDQKLLDYIDRFKMIKPLN